jgi:hypothetical protein
MILNLDKNSTLQNTGNCTYKMILKTNFMRINTYQGLNKKMWHCFHHTGNSLILNMAPVGKLGFVKQVTRPRRAKSERKVNYSTTKNENFGNI